MAEPKEVKDKTYWQRRALIAEANIIVNSQKMDALRKRSEQTVSKAARVSSDAKSLYEAEKERADSFEIDNAELEKQNKRLRETIQNGGGLISELETFLLELDVDSEEYKHIKRNLIRSSHPDKHQDLDTATEKAYNQLFRIINNLFGGK